MCTIYTVMVRNAIVVTPAIYLDKLSPCSKDEEMYRVIVSNYEERQKVTGQFFFAILANLLNILLTLFLFDVPNIPSVSCTVIPDTMKLK